MHVSLHVKTGDRSSRHQMHSNVYKHPRPGVRGRVVAALVNNRAFARCRRAVSTRLPFLKLSSDVKEIVYLTWLVPVHACRSHVPPGLELWQRNGLTPFTVLTYRHTNFGPSRLRRLRRFFPSPLQSNWRLYLERAPEGAKATRTVLFVKNVMSSVVYALATRLFSDALPTHLPATFTHHRDRDEVGTEITSGEGSSPDLRVTVRQGPGPELGKEFRAVFGSWSAAVEFLACQEAAVAAVDATDQVAFAEIHLPIDVSQILPAECVGEAPFCSMLQTLQPVDGPLCFVVKHVPFEVVSERLLRNTPTARSSGLPTAAAERER